MCTKAPPSLAFAMPGAIVTVCVPADGQRQANSTVSGILRLELDLFCQMPVVSVVSTPSTKTRACPASQHRSPSVPSSAMPAPVNVIDAGKAEVAIALLWRVALAHALAVAGEPLGFTPAAANASAYPPFVCQMVMVPGLAGPSNMRLYAPVALSDDAEAEAAACSHRAAKGCRTSAASAYIPSTRGST